MTDTSTTKAPRKRSQRPRKPQEFYAVLTVCDESNTPISGRLKITAVEVHKTAETLAARVLDGDFPHFVKISVPRSNSA